MTPALRIRCPAKVNLSLRVLGRRNDGYHELDTVFQAIALYDDLVLRRSDDLRLACDDPRVPTDEMNLVLRAARTLAEAHGVSPRGAFELHKRIPPQGGLGGGSSDAAGALMLCARAWGLASTVEELARVGASIGADVAFFLYGGTARGQGRGERISVLPTSPTTQLILGFPPFGLSTAEVFGRLQSALTPMLNGVSFSDVLAHKWQERKGFLIGENDLEEVVFRGWPDLGRFRDALLHVGAAHALLSGSGSTVFGVFEPTNSVDEALVRLHADFEGWTLLATHTVAEGVRMEGEP